MTRPEYDMPSSLEGKDLPDVLLPYQQALMQATSKHSVIIYEKSRRIGVTWGLGAEAVLTSATSKADGGMDTMYIGYSHDMTRDFIDVCAMWAKAFQNIVLDIEECLFSEVGADGETKDILAFRISFDSGFEILALTSKPRSLRGKQGCVIIDEAAFVDDLQELVKAAMAFLMWGGKVIIVSTHNSVDNYFNTLIQDARSGRKPYEVLKTDFDDALKDGLYKRICLVNGKEWTVKAEAEWRQEIVDFYAEDADEELFCIPKKSSGAYLSSVLVENCMVDLPVIRYSADDSFMDLPLHEREIETLQWCKDNLEMHLKDLDPSLRHSFGEDFGRSGDLTCLYPCAILQDLTRKFPFVVELRNIPFKQQEQIVFYILDRLPRLIGAGFDARGNGQQLAEAARDRYGVHTVHQVMTGPAWYLDAFPKYKAALEDGKVILPKDADILGDHRVAVMQAGIPCIPKKRTTGNDGGKRHGDGLVAAAMAYWASMQDFIEYGYQSDIEDYVTRGSLHRRDTSRDNIGSNRTSKTFGHAKGGF